MIGPPHLGAVLGIADCHDALVEIFQRRKEQLGLSHQWLDHHTGAASGTWDKILSSQRPLGRLALDRYLPILGCTIVVYASPLQERPKCAPNGRAAIPSKFACPSRNVRLGRVWEVSSGISGRPSRSASRPPAPSRSWCDWSLIVRSAQSAVHKCGPHACASR